MANFVWEAVSLYEKWASGGDLSEGEVFRLSSLLGAPTRKLEAALARYRDVFGRVVEERCASAPKGGEVCIYTWARWAFKRYFPAALDAGGTVLWKRGDGTVELLSYPLHRARDVGVKGVRLPGSPAALASPRVDGWQVNLYWDPLLGRWEFATRYVLHNMRFEGGRLTVAVYGERVNPVVQAAWEAARRAGLEARLGADLKGWTLTFMLEHREPATLLRRTPTPEDADSLRLILVAAREPGGRLLDPVEAAPLAEKLGVESLASRLLRGLEDPGEALRAAKAMVSHPSVFLWYPGDPEHPEIYEVKSEVYEDYLKATRAGDARSLVVLVTAGGPVVDALRDKLGALVDDVLSAVEELREAVKAAGSPDELRQLLVAAGIQPKLAASAAKALRDKPERAARIIAVASVEGFKAEEAAEVLRGVARAIRASASGGRGPGA